MESKSANTLDNLGEEWILMESLRRDPSKVNDLVFVSGQEMDLFHHHRGSQANPAPLLIAALVKNYTFLYDLVLSYNPDLYLLDNEDSDIMDHAVGMENVKIIQNLLDAGYDINHVDKHGMTPLQKANHGAQTFIRFLLERKADPNYLNPQYNGSENNIERGPFFESLDHSVECSRTSEFFDYNVNVNLRCADGYTPLMYAAHLGNIETVKLLLSRGADPFAKDAKGLTARDYAVETAKPYNDDDEPQDIIILLENFLPLDERIDLLISRAKGDFGDLRQKMKSLFADVHSYRNREIDRLNIITKDVIENVVGKYN